MYVCTYVCLYVYVCVCTRAPSGMWRFYFSYLVISLKMGEGWQEYLFSFLVTQVYQPRRLENIYESNFHRPEKFFFFFFSYTFALSHLCIHHSPGSKICRSQLQLGSQMGRKHQSLMKIGYWCFWRDTRKIVLECVCCWCKGTRSVLKTVLFKSRFCISCSTLLH